ncbi:uncharacterized protein DS421_20g706180 [Arachis hypogaea]|nr:uncharacterized protein DS421_20g706180 [Arachis hypogaea]
MTEICMANSISPATKWSSIPIRNWCLRNWGNSSRHFNFVAATKEMRHIKDGAHELGDLKPTGHEIGQLAGGDHEVGMFVAGAHELAVLNDSSSKLTCIGCVG